MNFFLNLVELIKIAIEEKEQPRKRCKGVVEERKLKVAFYQNMLFVTLLLDLKNETKGGGSIKCT